MSIETKQLNNWVSIRASTCDRQRAERLKQELKLSSVSAVFRQLLAEKTNQLGIG